LAKEQPRNDSTASGVVLKKGYVFFCMVGKRRTRRSNSLHMSLSHLAQFLRQAQQRFSLIAAHITLEKHFS
jgi:hypothetical protein